MIGSTNFVWTFNVKFTMVHRMAVYSSLDDGIGTVTLDRPDVRNAIDLATLDEVSAALDSLQADRAKAIVISGAGGAFCAGADLDLVRSAFEGDTEAVLGGLVDTLHPLVLKIRALPMPVIAAVEGPAVGAGAGLALAADFLIVAASAKLVPGYFGIGSSPDGGVSYFLTRALGAPRASSLIIRNRPLGADELLAVGLAESKVDDGQALDAAVDLARRVAGTPPLALLRLRHLVDLATTQGLDAQLDLERRLVAELWYTRDFREGVGAFLERRPAEFTGE